VSRWNDHPQRRDAFRAWHRDGDLEKWASGVGVRGSNQ
jgi:hypothetical protein